MKLISMMSGKNVSKKKRKAKIKNLGISRLHLSLLGMHNGNYRVNGGLGFTIENPSCELAILNASDFSINDLRDYPLIDNEQEKLLTLLQTIKKQHNFCKTIKVDIYGNMFPHSGFGSGTAITLACLEALHQFNGSFPSSAELIAESGRGGTSGVGIYTYFSGGCVFDLGRSIDNQCHAPSHQITPVELPLLLNQLPMPNWDIGVCIPLTIPRKTQAEEREFFTRTCPLSAEAVYQTTYHTLFGLYAAIREADRTVFCRALRSIQDCAWKQAERMEYGAALIEIEQALYHCGAQAVGMSSLGPSLFFLAENVAEMITEMRLTRPDCEWILTKPANQGRKLIHA